MTETGAWHRTLCPYCGVGCGLLVKVTEGVVSRVKGDPEHPANFGDVCAKAIHLPPVLRTEDRLLYPQLRPHRGAVPIDVNFLLPMADHPQLVGIDSILTKRKPVCLGALQNVQLLPPPILRRHHPVRRHRLLRIDMTVRPQMSFILHPVRIRAFLDCEQRDRPVRS